MKNVGKIITYILIVLLLVGTVGIVIKFTNGGTTDFKTFYVEADGKTYLDSGKFALKHGENRFETKYTFANNNADKHKGYTVKIVPNTTEETDFNFVFNGETISFGSIGDLTASFDIRKDKTGFCIVDNGITVESVLQDIFGDIELNDIQFDYSKAYFNLIVSSYNGENSVVIELLVNVPVTGVDLDKDDIVF